MATNKELDRMIMNVEQSIGIVMDKINCLVTVWDHKKQRLNDEFLQLRSQQSKLIEVSTKLQLQHCDNYQKTLKITKGE